MGRKSFEVVGYAMDGYLLCVDCHGSEAQCETVVHVEAPSGADATHCAHAPVFLDDCQPEDTCDACLSRWATDPKTRHAVLMGGPLYPPPWIYLDGEGPREQGLSEGGDP